MKLWDKLKTRFSYMRSEDLRRSWNVAILCLVAFFALSTALSALSKSYGIGINSTPSEVEGLYWHHPLKEIRRGELVMLHVPNAAKWYRRGYIRPGEWVIKSIGGMPGDYLFTKQNTVYRCQTAGFDKKDCIKLGKCLMHDEKGRSLTCQSWYAYRIPQDEYYMMSQRVKNSFDSRYFGLIPKLMLKGKIHLLWRFS